MKITSHNYLLHIMATDFLVVYIKFIPIHGTWDIRCHNSATIGINDILCLFTSKGGGLFHLDNFIQQAGKQSEFS